MDAVLSIEWMEWCFLGTHLLSRRGCFGDKIAPEISVTVVNIFSYFKNAFFSLHCFFSVFLFLIRKVNGPGTPRPLNRPKLSLANPLAANGLPDSTGNKDLSTEQEDSKDSRYGRSHNARKPFSRVFQKSEVYLLFLYQWGFSISRFPRELCEEQTHRRRRGHGSRTAGGEET